MTIENTFKDLPKNLRAEEKLLTSLGIKTWSEVKDLGDKDIKEICQAGKSSSTNLKKIRGMAVLICELNLSQPEAALLLHSGIGTIKALANSSPQQLVLQAGRLVRQLNIGPVSFLNLRKANNLINRAKNSRILN